MDINNREKRIIVLEGINGVGKSTLFNALKGSFTEDSVGFVSFKDYGKHNHNAREAGEYVNSELDKVWSGYDIIVSDRWFTSNLLYERDNLYFGYLKDEYKSYIFPYHSFFIQPQNLLKTYLRAVIRNFKTSNGKSYNIFNYIKMNKLYNNFYKNKPLAFVYTILKDNDFANNYRTLYKFILSTLSKFEDPELADKLEDQELADQLETLLLEDFK